MAINFWAANSFNIFLSGNHTQSNASATGAVWVGQTATYNNYNVGADLPMATPQYMLSLQVLGNMDITGGINYSQNSGIDALGTVTKYTMHNNNNVPNQPVTFQYRPYDIYTYSFLFCSAIGWAYINSNSTQKVSGTALTLTGTDPNLNNFLISSANVAGSGLNISAISSINIVVPPLSTAIISIDGQTVTLNNFITLMNGVAITKAQGQYVLWNFPEALTLNLNANIYGSLLAPYATIISGLASTLFGTLMATNLQGGLNATKNEFLGSLPDLYDPSSTHSCTSFTTSSSTTSTSTTSTTTTTTTTSSTTTTTTSTSSTSSTTCAPRCQAISDIIESVALEQTALSHILNAEGEKIQKAMKLNLTTSQRLEINDSVAQMLNSVSELETILQNKVSLFNDCLCGGFAK